VQDSLIEPAGSHEPQLTKTPKKAAISAWIGSALEYYDFFIYGTAAALIFPKIFFPSGNSAAATIASLATFGVAYVARPIGSFIMGHVGDKYGRKNVMVITLFGMGLATFLIGVLPTYEQIGFAAPLLLLILRLCQGLAVSGEQSGATSMTLEHAPANRRAFFSSFTLAGTQGGSILATAIFIPIAAMAPDSLLSWGWRIPFLLSAVVMVVGWWIRRTLHETPAFEEEEVHHVVPKAPLKVLFRNYTADVLKVMLCALVSVVGTIFGIYTLTYGVNTMGLSRTSLLWMQILANVVALGAIPLWALVGDRIGRKPVFFIGALGTAALVWPFIWAISEKNLPLVFVIGILLSGVVYSAYGGVGFALFSEQFDTKVRMSGMAIGTQFGFAIGGFAPTIAALLAGPTLENWVPVAIFGCVAAVIASFSALTMRETYKVHMNDLGKPRKAAKSAVSV